MSKVLIIGIDSLSPTLLTKFGEDLPNFSRLRRMSPAVRLRSIFPPDSIPAWVTIYTGLNPAKHGLVYAQDVFGTQQRELLSFDSSRFQGKTFWDYAGKAGKKVCILLPYVAYPSWPVNGVMVARARTESKVPNAARWISETEIQTDPREAASEHQIPNSMRTVFGNYPGRKMLGRYAEDIWKTISNDAEFALRICRECDWDLFFVYSYLLDTIQHFFWRYGDDSDPRYPGAGPYQDIIKDSYRLFDKVVGDFMDAHPDATIVVMSDHGHGMRPPRTVNINAFLQTKGLLTSKANKRNPALYLVGKSKSRLLDVVHKHELDYWLLNIASAKALKPLSKRVYMSSSSVDMEQSKAFLSAFAGPKSYSHGGVEINKRNTSEMGYEELRSLVIKELSDLREPDTNEKLITWICRREELYSGPHLSLYPDVVFELREGYGVYWDVNANLIGTAYEHNIAPGGHKKDAVFLISRLEGKSCARTDMTLMDVAPTILDLLGLDSRGNPDSDGSSILGG
jgi:predicted AlkP superfamily phosphohydrolase/phosphomutase